MDACPADAIGSLAERIDVNPHLCQGGGVCAAVCPTGAMAYAYPGPEDTQRRLKRLLTGYTDHHGLNPIILFGAETDIATLADKVRATLHLWCDTLRDEGPLLLRLTDDVAHPSLSSAVEARRERAVDVWQAELEASLGIDGADARLLAATLTAGSTAVLRRWIRDRLDRREVIERFVVMTRGQIDAVSPAAG